MSSVQVRGPISEGWRVKSLARAGATTLCHVFFLLTALGATACTEEAGVGATLPRQGDSGEEQLVTAGAKDRVELTGTRLTQGNAVDCPQLRDDSGKIHGVSTISAVVPIGGRVHLTGFYGITTSCRGTVLIVESETILPD